MKLTDADYEYKKTKGTAAFVGLVIVILAWLDVLPV